MSKFSFARMALAHTFCMTVTALSSAAPSPSLDLAGAWRFQLDRDGVGATQQWFAQKLPGTLALPGSLPGQGIGDPLTVDTKWTGGIFDRSWFTAPEYAPYREPGHIKVPFWLQPETHYVGATWFQRDLEIPATLHGRVASVTGKALPTTVTLSGEVAGFLVQPARQLPVASDGRFSSDFVLGAEAGAWDEFTPALHRIIAQLDNGDRREVTFGLREIAATGRQLTLNGRKLFLRGALDCAAFPRTGHPPTDVASWKHEFTVIQSHGLNHVRFHSWCPPEAAFVAADELGLYLQIEVASWPNQSTTLGDGHPVDAWLEAETDRILRAYGNHPSFVALCACNEPGGDAANPWLASWVTRHKARDDRRIYTAGAGWPDIAENDYHIRSEPRIQHWEEGLKSRINALPPETRSDYRAFIAAHRVPVVSHEIGQWCAYPNFAEMPKYTGYLKPRNFEIFRASLDAHHLLDQAQDFLLASGKLQALCYKEDIESALRTPEMGGFQLLGLADFPGQGTALVGVLDAFWEEKGYISSAEFRRFCGATVPLARLDKRVFTADEHLVADIEVAHFGAAPLAEVHGAWRLVADDGHVAAQGEFAPRPIAVEAGTQLGRIELGLSAVPSAARYKLVVSLGRASLENDWDIWVYPPASTTAAPALPAGLVLTSTLDRAAESALAAGGTVWLAIPPARVRPDAHKGPVALGYSSIFWNTAWTHGQPPHTLGILCDPHHPALAAFPTDSHTNWQWWFVVTHAAAMILDDLPAPLRPTVQVIDDWVTNRKLGLVFEARIGRGKLLVTSIDLNEAGLDPVRRQLRTSLLDYVASPRFAPSLDLTIEQVRRLRVD